MLSPAAGSEKADTSHQSTSVNRKHDDGCLHVPKFHGLQSPVARNEIQKNAEVTGEAAKRPGDQGEIQAVQA